MWWTKRTGSLFFLRSAGDEVEESLKKKTIEVRVFGKLRRHLGERILPLMVELPGKRDAARGVDLALELGLPPEEVEAVFCNGHVQNIYDTVHPGDRVAFLPHGTPGPYRAFLGIWNEGRKAEEKRKEREEETSGRN